MKKKIFVIGGIVIFAGVIGAGAWYYLHGRDQMTTSGEVAYVTKISSLDEDSTGLLNRWVYFYADRFVRVLCEN